MRRLLPLLLLTATATTAYYARTFYLADQSKAQALLDQAARVKSLEAKLAREQAKDSAEIQQEKAQIAALEFREKNEDDAIDVARRRLERLRDGVDDKGALANLQDDLRRERDYVKDLETQLKQVQAQRVQTGAQTKQADSQVTWNQRSLDQDYKDRIAAATALLRATRDEISLTRKRARTDFNARSQLASLQDQENQQKSALDQLKAQAHQASYDSAQAHAQNHQASAELQAGLSANEKQLRATYDYERERVRQLERDLGASKMNKGALQAQILEAKRDLDSHQSQLAAIRHELAQRRERLKLISQP